MIEPMKYKSFLSFVPLFFVVSLVLLVIAEEYDGRATLVGYQSDRKEWNVYDGEHIQENGTDSERQIERQDMYNGENLKDNGLPYAIKVNASQNVVTVYQLGTDGYYSKPVKAMICSVGEGDNTPKGVFDLGDREEWLALEDGVYGQYATAITGNILFHSVPYFTKDKGDLEIEEYNKLGRGVSAGCVRLSVVDAKWIFEHCNEFTQVNIFESDYLGPMGKPIAAIIDSKGKGNNWDPTDPDRDNPYMSDIPVILGAYDREIERYSDFDILAGITALDSTGKDITDCIETEGDVDWQACGVYPITFSVTDETGVKESVTAKYIIKDEQAPVIRVDQVVNKISAYDVNSTRQLHDLLLKNVTVYDGNYEMDKASILVDFSEIFDKKVGRCHIKYRAKDSEGNQSEVVILSVDVDLEAPIIQLKNESQGELRVSRLMDDAYLLSLVEVSDNSGNVDVTLSRPLSYVPGEVYNVIYCARDNFGNVTTLCVTYQIKD
ncbi:MAG: DUF5011 domain-containing protein [Eubacteriales bacterium]|nr:DUF5011 domain-containing protein [Eubacteriales bacterium]